MPDHVAYEQLPADVRLFLEQIATWQPARWTSVLTAADRDLATSHRHQAVALRDAILSVEHLQLAAWFADDAATDAVETLRTAGMRMDHDRARQLAADAALALLARPALPSRELAVLLAPFLPLALPER